MARTKEQRKGDYCERKVRDELRLECTRVVGLRKGADFLCIKPDGSEKMVEAKCNRSRLTTFQKNVKKAWKKSGKRYEIRRCSCPR